MKNINLVFKNVKYTACKCVTLRTHALTRAHTSHFHILDCKCIVTGRIFTIMLYQTSFLHSKYI